MMLASIVGLYGAIGCTGGEHRCKIGSQGMSRYNKKRVPTVHPIAPTGPTIQANIIVQITLFLGHPVFSFNQKKIICSPAHHPPRSPQAWTVWCGSREWTISVKLTLISAEKNK